MDAFAGMMWGGAAGLAAGGMSPFSLGRAVCCGGVGMLLGGATSILSHDRHLLAMLVGAQSGTLLGLTLKLAPRRTVIARRAGLVAGLLTSCHLNSSHPWKRVLAAPPTPSLPVPLVTSPLENYAVGYDPRASHWGQ
jgi:hypothetical protein